MRIESGPKRRASRGTDGLAVVGAIEANALRGEAVEVRSVKASRAIAIEHVAADRFTADDDSLTGRSVRRLLRQRTTSNCAAHNGGGFKKTSSIHLLIGT